MSAPASLGTVDHWKFYVDCTGGAIALNGINNVCDTPTEYNPTSNPNTYSITVLMSLVSPGSRAMTGMAAAYKADGTLIGAASHKTVVSQ